MKIYTTGDILKRFLSDTDPLQNQANISPYAYYAIEDDKPVKEVPESEVDFRYLIKNNH